MNKKTARIFAITVFLSILLFPCSHSSTSAFENRQTQTFPSLNQSSLSFSEYKVLLEVEDAEIIDVYETIVLKNEFNTSITDLSLYYNETISITAIEDDFQEITNFTLNPSNNLFIVLNSPLEPNESREIDIIYSVENIITQWYQNYLRLYFEYYKYLTLKETVTVRLPRHSEIWDQDGAILPPADTFGVGFGYLEIYWFDSIENFVQVIFKLQKNLIWLYIVGPIIGLAVGIGGTLWFVKKREEKTMKVIGKIFLSETEKMILKLISENGGKVTQGELSSLTGFTKTKVSRNLISLEKQELIVREKWGKNYRVYISEMGQKVVE